MTPIESTAAADYIATSGAFGHCPTAIETAGSWALARRRAKCYSDAEDFIRKHGAAVEREAAQLGASATDKELRLAALRSIGIEPKVGFVMWFYLAWYGAWAAYYLIKWIRERRNQS